MPTAPSTQEYVGKARGWQRPVKVSLGLLPSGPDPVGEEHVRANLPVGYMARDCGKGKRFRPRSSALLQMIVNCNKDDPKEF